MCAHRLADGPLVCDRTTRHDEDVDGGHTYSSTSAGDDRHMDGGHG